MTKKTKKSKLDKLLKELKQSRRDFEKGKGKILRSLKDLR